MQYCTLYDTAFTILGVLLDSPELPISGFSGNIEKAVSEFALPTSHHVQPSPSYRLPVIKTQFKFVREDAIVNLLLLLFISAVEL